jgi:hypothetical protein
LKIKNKRYASIITTLSSTHENGPSLAIVYFQFVLFSLFSHKNIILVIFTRQCGLDEVEHVTFILSSVMTDNNNANRVFYEHVNISMTSI